MDNAFDFTLYIVQGQGKLVRILAAATIFNLNLTHRGGCEKVSLNLHRLISYERKEARSGHI